MADHSLRPAAPSARPRPSRKRIAALLLSSSLSVVVLFAAYGHRVRLRAYMDAAMDRAGAPHAKQGGGFVEAVDFPLRDSLPALEGGLSNLEAFRASMSPSRKANRDRTLWISDSIATISLEYLTQRERIDSVTLMLWAGDGPLRTKTVRSAGAATWAHAHRRSVRDWTEAVAVYRSFPPFIALESADPSVALFVQAEGKVFHVVNGWYLNRRESASKPDTSYPIVADDGHPEPLRLMARGTAIAIVNTMKTPVTLRLTGTTDREDIPPAKKAGDISDGLSDDLSVILFADSMHVSVYRNILKERHGTLMAYTEPGITVPVFRKSTVDPQRFFVLMR